MTISYVSRKCGCGGKLQYDKSRKVWICQYCGAEVEREEHYDTLFTIKNVVRQTLLDVAYRRLDNAEKNLTECEKIDSRYIGTIIATLCFLMIKVITPGACGQSESKAIMAKIKRYKNLLETEQRDISEEEEALYEFFESDIYATLMLVYDTMNQLKRRDFIRQLINIDDVFSLDTNKNLITYSVKNQDMALLDGIVKNSDYIDKKFALSEILSKYPDSPKKLENTEILFIENVFEQEDRDLVDNYLIETSDSFSTKAQIVCTALKSGIKVTTSVIIKNILAGIQDASIVKLVIEHLCSGDLNDEEIGLIIEYSLSAPNEEIAVIVMKVLKSSGKFVSLGHKQVISFLCRNNLDYTSKVNILKAAYEFEIDNKAREVVVADYLCLNKDDSEARLQVIDFLLSTVKNIPTTSFVKYVLTVNTDGSNKPAIVQKVLDLSVNTSFYYDLLSKYIFSNCDGPKEKELIISGLLDRGIKIDAKEFSKYILSEDGNYESKIHIVKLVMDKGAALQPDTLSKYLIELRDFEKFSSDLFDLLLNSTISVKDDALCNYLLYCKDVEPARVRNTFKLASKVSTPFGSQSCQISHLGKQIKCNLLQGYLLLTKDSYDTAAEILRKMLSEKGKPSTSISIDGRAIKFKKYFSDNLSQVSPVAGQLCREHRLLSIFS